MMKKQHRGLNKYIHDYDKLRTFLRYISYGCYHKSYLTKKLWLSARSYEDNWARVQFFLPEDRLQSVRQGHREIHSLKGDSYQSAHNDLARFYQIKSLTNSSAFLLLTILQSLTAAKQPLSETELQQYWLTPVNRPYPKSFAEISRSTLHRYLNELTMQGILHKEQQQGHFVYRLSSDVFAGFSDEEVCQLQAAMAFYRNVSCLSVPGYFLEQTLEQQYPLQMKKAVTCQFKHTAMTRLLDDEILNCLIYCIETKKTVHFLYRQREAIAVPQKIVTDYYVGRQYLQALVKGKPTAKVFNVQQNLRIDWMKNVRVGEAVELTVGAKPSAKQLLQFELYYDDEREKERLLLRLHEHEKGVTVSVKDEHILFCQMQVMDELKLMPWLRTFYPQIRIVSDGPAKLKQRMQEDIKEALANYGVCTTIS